MKLETIVESKIFISILSFICGGIVKFWIDRLKTLEYNMFHERVAFAVDDPTFGNVCVTWNESNVDNLFVSTAILTNTTTKDYTDLKVKVYTNTDILLLTQYTEIVGTSFHPSLTEEFKESIRVPDNKEPTKQQLKIYHHSREFLIPVFNRNQKLLIRFLVTIPNSKQMPEIWMETLYPGLKLKYAVTSNQILGISEKITAPLGIVISLIIVILSILFIAEIWIASVICIITGLFAQHIAAVIYKSGKFIKKILFG